MKTVEIFYKTTYVLVLFTSLGLFISQVASCLKHYYEYNTSISLDVQCTCRSSFPAFTICPEYNAAYKSDILAQYNSSPQAMRKIQYPKNINMSALEFFEFVTYSVDEIVSKISIRVSKKSKNNITGIDPLDWRKIFMPINSKGCKTQTYLLFGRCYTFTVPLNIRKLKASNS